MVWLCGSFAKVDRIAIRLAEASPIEYAFFTASEMDCADAATAKTVATQANVSLLISVGLTRILLKSLKHYTPNLVRAAATGLGVPLNHSPNADG
jgi:hypothetical protein